VTFAERGAVENNKSNLRDLMLLWRCSWRFKSSGMYCRVDWAVVRDVSDAENFLAVKMKAL